MVICSCNESKSGGETETSSISQSSSVTGSVLCSSCHEIPSADISRSLDSYDSIDVLDKDFKLEDRIVYLDEENYSFTELLCQFDEEALIVSFSGVKTKTPAWDKYNISDKDDVNLIYSLFTDLSYRYISEALQNNTYLYDALFIKDSHKIILYWEQLDLRASEVNESALILHVTNTGEVIVESLNRVFLATSTIDMSVLSPYLD